MSIKMSDLLDLPYGRISKTIFGDKSAKNLLTLIDGTQYQVEYICTAINSYDSNQELIVKLQAEVPSGFSQKDSRIAALEEREANLLTQLKFAVTKHESEVNLLRDALESLLEIHDYIRETREVISAKRALAATGEKS